MVTNMRYEMRNKKRLKPKNEFNPVNLTASKVPLPFGEAR